MEEGSVVGENAAVEETGHAVAGDEQPRGFDEAGDKALEGGSEKRVCWVGGDGDERAKERRRNE